jgi:hypothetical protein
VTSPWLWIDTLQRPEDPENRACCPAYVDADGGAVSANTRTTLCSAGLLMTTDPRTHTVAPTSFELMHRSACKTVDRSRPCLLLDRVDERLAQIVAAIPDSARHAGKAGSRLRKAHRAFRPLISGQTPLYWPESCTVAD